MLTFIPLYFLFWLLVIHLFYSFDREFRRFHLMGMLMSYGIKYPSCGLGTKMCAIKYYDPFPFGICRGACKLTAGRDHGYKQSIMILCV